MLTLRSPLIVATLLALGGCSIAPQLTPSAAGCYAVQLDSFPESFRKALVPPPPTLVRLDTAFGGLVQVPAEWLEAGGYRQRGATLLQQRPLWTIREGQVVVEGNPAPGGIFPPDSLALRFSGPGESLTALLSAQPSGDWEGLGFVISSFTQHGQPVVPMRLRRSTCGTTRMAISR
jgi:hypothetical protein